MKNIYAFLGAIVLWMSGNREAAAQLTITTGQTAEQMAQTLVGQGIVVLNATLECPDSTSYGIFSGSSNLGIDSGIVLTTGRAATNPGIGSIGINGPASLLANGAMGTAGDANITAAINAATWDACKLEFDVIPSGEVLRFNYVMGTEEFPYFRCGPYADGFGFYLSGPGYAAPVNIARIPNSNTPVTVRNVFCDSATNLNYSTGNVVINSGSTVVYNAFTNRFVAKAVVQPCNTYHLKLVVADATDLLVDSGVFLEKGSMSSPGTTVSALGGSTNGVDGLSTPKPYAVRGCANGKFTFKRAYALPTPLTISYQIAGTAVNGVDYASIPASVTIPANATSIDRIITPLTTASGLKTVKLLILGANACGATVVDSASLDIRDSLYAVLPLSAGTLCSGQSQTISVAGDNLLSYSWSPAAGTSAASAGTVTLTPAATTTYQMTAVFPGTGCPAVHDTLRITVPTNPAILSSNSPVCQGSSLNLSCSSTPGTTYSWTGPNSFSSTAQNPALNGMSALMEGSYALTVSAGGCTFAPITTPVSIAAAPAQPGAVSGSSLVCAGSSSNPYTIGAVPSATSYDWTASGSGWSGAGTGLSFNPVAGSGAGTVSVTASNACGVSPARTYVISTQAAPAQPAAISGSSLVCSGTSSNAYTITSVPSAASYAWTVSGTGWSGTGNGLSFAPTAGSGTGTLSVTASNVCGASPAQTYTVSTQTVPAQPASISGQASVCEASAQSYAITAVPSATSYGWTVTGTGWSSSGSGTSLAATAGTGNATISVTAVNVCGTSAAATLPVSVTPLVTPAVSSLVSSGSTICAGATATFTAGAITNGGSSPGFQWKKNGNNVGSNSASYSDTGLLDGDVISLVMTSSLSCKTAPTASAANITMTVKPLLAPAVSISASTPYTVCDGTPVTFTASPANGGTVPAYQWKKNGSNIGGNSPTYTSSTLMTGDVVTVVMTTGTQCYTNPTAISAGLPMTVNTVLPTAVTLTSSAANNPTCVGTNVAFLALPSNGGSAPAYHWFKNGVSVGNGGATYNTSSWTSSDVFSVTMTSSEQCAAAPTVTSNNLSVLGQSLVTPAVSISSSTGTSVCEGGTISFEAAGVNCGPAASYLWMRNGNAVASGPSYSSNLFSDGDIVTVEMTGSLPCATAPAATSNAMSVSVTPLVFPGINVNVTPPQSLCAGAVRTFMANIAGGGSLPQYQWQINGANVGSNSSTFITNSLASGDTVRCVLTSSATCALTPTQASNRVGVTVYPLPHPAASISASPSLQLVIGQLVTFTADIVDGGPSPVLQWYRNSIGIPNATGATYTSSSLQPGDVISVQLLSSADCASGLPVHSNTLVMAGSTGISSSPALAGIRMYPNPSSGRLVLEGSGRPGQRQDIEVVNSIGQVVFRTGLVSERSEWRQELDLGEAMASGAYILRLENGDGRVQQPFVLQR